jgi:hypothetical protein
MQKLYFGKIGKKLHTNQMRWVIEGMMLNVGMWVHDSIGLLIDNYHKLI